MLRCASLRLQSPSAASGRPNAHFRQPAPNASKRLTASLTRAPSWSEAVRLFAEGIVEQKHATPLHRQFWLRALLRRCGRADWTVCLSVYAQLLRGMPAIDCVPAAECRMLLERSEVTRAALVYGTMRNWQVALQLALGRQQEGNDPRRSSSSTAVVSQIAFPPIKLPLAIGAAAASRLTRDEQHEQAEVVSVLDTALRSAAQAGAWAPCLSLFARAGFSYRLRCQDVQRVSASAANVGASEMVYARLALSMMVALLEAQHHLLLGQERQQQQHDNGVSAAPAALVESAASQLFDAYHDSRAAMQNCDTDELTVIELRLHTTYCRLLTRAGRWQDALRIGTRLAPFPAEGSNGVVESSVAETRWSLALRALASVPEATWATALAVGAGPLQLSQIDRDQRRRARVSAAPAQAQTWERVFAIKAWSHAPPPSSSGDDVTTDPALEGAIRFWLAGVSRPMDTARSTDAMRMRCSVTLASVFHHRFALSRRSAVNAAAMLDAVARGSAAVADDTRLWAVPLLCCVAQDTSVEPEVARRALERCLDLLVKVNASDFVHSDVNAVCMTLLDCMRRRSEPQQQQQQQQQCKPFQPLALSKIRTTVSTLRAAPWVFELQLLLLMELQAPCLSAADIKQRSDLAAEIFDKWKAHALLNGSGDAAADVVEANHQSQETTKVSTVEAMSQRLRAWMLSHHKHVAPELLQRVTAAPPLEQVDALVAEHVEAAIRAKQEAVRTLFHAPLPSRETEDDDRWAAPADETAAASDAEMAAHSPPPLGSSALFFSERMEAALRQRDNAALSPARIQHSLLVCAQRKRAEEANQQHIKKKLHAAGPRARTESSPERKDESGVNDGITTVFQAAVAARKLSTTDAAAACGSQPPSFVPNGERWSKLLLESAMSSGQWQRAHFFYLRALHSMSFDEHCKFVRFDLDRGGDVSALVALATTVVPKLATTAPVTDSSEATAKAAVAAAQAVQVGIDAFLRCGLWRSALCFVSATETRNPGTLKRVDNLNKLLTHPAVSPAAIFALQQRGWVTWQQAVQVMSLSE